MPSPSSIITGASRFFTLGLIGLLASGCSDTSPETAVSTPAAASSAVSAAAASGTVSPVSTTPTGGAKVVVVGEPEIDFGVYQAGGRGEHTFILRNEGDGPLVLQSGGSSCKCTAMELGGTNIAAGEETQVRMEWTTENATESFRHGTILYTNDPDRPRVDLTVRGRVRQILLTSTDAILFQDVSPGEPLTQSVLVYSQTRDDLAPPEVETSAKVLNVNVQPADAAALTPLEGLSGYLIEVTLDTADLKLGTSESRLNMMLTAPAGTDVSGKQVAALQEQLTLPVQVTVPGDVAYFGKVIDRFGMVDLGKIPAGQSRRERFFMLVGGEHRDFTVSQVRCQPEYLQARVTPMAAASAKRARYQIEVEIPAGAPAASFLGDQAAVVEIITDDPAAPPMQFHVQFAVY